MCYWNIQFFFQSLKSLNPLLTNFQNHVLWNVRSVTFAWGGRVGVISATALFGNESGRYAVMQIKQNKVFYMTVTYRHKSKLSCNTCGIFLRFTVIAIFSVLLWHVFHSKVSSIHNIEFLSQVRNSYDCLIVEMGVVIRSRITHGKSSHTAVNGAHWKWHKIYM